MMYKGLKMVTFDNENEREACKKFIDNLKKENIVPRTETYYDNGWKTNVWYWSY